MTSRAGAGRHAGVATAPGLDPAGGHADRFPTFMKTMSSEEQTPQEPTPGSESTRCEHTGLSKPECHCPECTRELVSRFRRARED